MVDQDPGKDCPPFLCLLTSIPQARIHQGEPWLVKCHCYSLDKTLAVRSWLSRHLQNYVCPPPQGLLEGGLEPKT